MMMFEYGSFSKKELVNSLWYFRLYRFLLVYAFAVTFFLISDSFLYSLVFGCVVSFILGIIRSLKYDKVFRLSLLFWESISLLTFTTIILLKHGKLVN